MVAGHRILGIGAGFAVLTVLLTLAGLLLGPELTQAQNDAPMVTDVSVTSNAGDDDTYLLGETIRITLTFSETVNVTGAPRLKIDMDPAEWGTKWASYHSGSGTANLTFTHTVVEPNLSTQGIAVLENTLELNGGSIKSASSQTDADLSHTGLAHNPRHKVDWRRSPPAPTPTPTPEPTPTPTPPSDPAVTEVEITSNAGDDDTYLLGETIRITLTFSETVDVTGTPRLMIDMDPAGWGTKWAGYESGSGTDSLTFTHTVVEPNLSTQGIAVLADTLELNGGAIRSASSQTDADLSHVGLAHNPRHKVDWRRSPPAPTQTPAPEPTPTPTPPPAPSVTGVAVTSNAGDDDTYLLGETIRITLTFSETVNVTGAPRLKIDMDPAEWGEKWAAYESGSGTASLTFTHTVVEPNISTQGIAVLANSLELNGGSIKSASSNTDADLSHVGLAHDAEHKVDWQRSQPNRAPVVNAGTWNYQRFIGNNNAPRGILVSKSFYQVFIDPDGDELTYSVSIPDHHRQLLDEFSIGLDYRTPENSHRSLEVFHRVWFRAEDDTDWKAVSPALADPVVVTATVTATDPEGLSVSLEGDFLIWWESHPEVVRAVGSEQAIVLTFDVAVEDDPAPTPEQFTVHVANGDGTTGTIAVNGATVNGAVLTLGLATELAEGQVVTLDYAHDADTPLQRVGGGDPAPDFVGQAVATLPDAVANFTVIADPGEKDVWVSWDAVDGATSYKLRWRQSGGEFETANLTTVAGAIQFITVSDYGQWEVRVQACNDAGCGPEASSTAEVVKSASLRLARAVDAEGNVRPRTLTADWDPVEGASSYTLRWRRIGKNTQAQAQAEPAADARQARSAADSPVLDQSALTDRPASDDGGQGANAQPNSQLTFTADQTSADLTVPDAGAYRAELQARGDGNELIALASTNINQAHGQPDTTPPWLVRGQIDGNRMTLYFSEPLDEDAVGGHFRTLVKVRRGFWRPGTPSPTIRGTSRNIEITGNKVTVGLGSLRAREGLRAYMCYSRYGYDGIGSLRDLAGNPIFTPDNNCKRRYVRLVNIAGPSYVHGVSISSDPGADRFYVDGQTIRVKLTFSEAVNVTGTPRVKIDFGSGAGDEKWADYAGGSGTRMLEFAYTVVEGDLCTEGLAVLANTLELNGGTIRSAWATAEEHAKLRHAGLRHDPDHRVVTPDTAAPVLVSAAVTGAAMTLIFNEALGAAASLANDAFTVEKTPQGGVEQEVSLSGSPSMSGAAVTLTLASAVLSTDAFVKVSYAKPTTGSNNKLVDAGGAEVASFSHEWVMNTLDTTQPRLVRGEIDGDTITFYFSEPLDKNPVDGHFRASMMLDTGTHHTFTTTGKVEIRDDKVTVGLGDGRRARAGVTDNHAHYGFFPDTDVTILQDLAGNPVETPGRVGHDYHGTRLMILDNITGPPYVSDVAISSDPGADRTYTRAETIRVKLTFSEAVNVTGTPRLKIDLDPATGGEQWVNYTSGSGTKMLEFAYTVVEPNVSTQGIAVLQNMLELNGGAIRSASATTEENANLAHAGLNHNANHLVDWQR